MPHSVPLNLHKASSALAILIPTVTFGLQHRPTEMGISLVAGATCAAFLNIDKIARFKGGGFEAETREIIERANATVDQLRAVAAPLLRAGILQTAFMDRWATFSDDVRARIINQFRLTAAEIGLDGQDEIRSALETADRLSIWFKLGEIARAANLENYGEDPTRDIGGTIDLESKRFPSQEEILSLLQTESPDGLTGAILDAYVGLVTRYEEEHR